METMFKKECGQARDEAVEAANENLKIIGDELPVIGGKLANLVLRNAAICTCAKRKLTRVKCSPDTEQNCTMKSDAAKIRQQTIRERHLRIYRY